MNTGGSSARFGRDRSQTRVTKALCLCLLYPALVVFGVLALYNSGYIDRTTSSQVPVMRPALPIPSEGITGGVTHIDESRGFRDVQPSGLTAWNWLDVFSFVPNGLTHCPDLFPHINKSAPFPASFQREYDAFIKKLASLGKLDEGTSASYIEEYIAYYHLVQAPFIRTVCETGFNAGHSSFMWLQANPNTTVYSFDIGKHHYARSMAEYLQTQFSGRLTVIWGDSTKTLPLFHSQHPTVKCDVISIDGGHNNRVCLSDYETFRQMASKDNIILLDNYPDNRSGWMQKLGDVWESAKREGQLIEIFQCNYAPKKPQGFSVGRLNPYYLN